MGVLECCVSSPSLHYSTTPVLQSAVSPGGAIATEDAPEEVRRTMPGPESAGNRFTLAAEAGMELSGHRLTLKEGRLVIDAR